MKCCLLKIHKYWDFPGVPVVENLPSDEGDAGLIPGCERSESRSVMSNSL